MRTWNMNERYVIIKIESVYNKEYKTCHMHYQTMIKLFEGGLKFIRELEICKINLRTGISKIKFERNWNFGNYLGVWDF